MAKKKSVKPKWFRHEAMHTTNVCVEMVSDHLENHHYYHSGINPKYNKQIDLAIKHLAKAYQMCADDNNETRKKMKAAI